MELYESEGLKLTQICFDDDKLHFMGQQYTKITGKAGSGKTL